MYLSDISLLIFIKKFVIVIFISFFDEVSNFRNRILTNQAPELVKRICHMKNFLYEEFPAKAEGRRKSPDRKWAILKMEEGYGRLKSVIIS